MYCISGMDLCAVLDILEHLIIVKVRQMYNQEITKTITGKNLSELVPNYLGPHITQESRENFRQIIHQVQNN